MRPIFFFLAAVCCWGCNDTEKLQTQIDNLQIQAANAYKPGFGEFMSGIQIHHAKLWFAGKNSNWKLADFELGEIREAVENIQKFQAERKESKMLSILTPAMDSIKTAIQREDERMFLKGFSLLTVSCNNCHRAAKYEFNVVVIPANPPFSNQDFTVRKP